jgi:hypothetical protein
MCIKRCRSLPRVVHSDLDVKCCVAALPSVDRVRPAQCPCCAAASRPVGHPLGLLGHGSRERQHLERRGLVRSERFTGCSMLMKSAPVER